MTQVTHHGVAYDDDWYTLKYLKGGKQSHLVAPSDLASCGAYPRTYGWYGTGSQEEREKAERLPICINCKKHIHGEGDA